MCVHVPVCPGAQVAAVWCGRVAREQLPSHMWLVSLLTLHGEADGVIRGCSAPEKAIVFGDGWSFSVRWGPVS